MEAIATHEFNATSDDELSFPKNATLKIINMEEGKEWFTAEFNGRQGMIPVNYIDMKDHPWYVRKITSTGVEAMLLEKGGDNEYIQQDGAFLISPSESTPGDFSLSVKFGDQVQCFNVLRDGASKYFLWVVKFNSLNQLVDYHRTASVSRTETIYLQEMIRPKMIASYDFKPQNPNELELNRGDVITILDKKDPDWWMGEIQRDQKSQRGLFPKTYVSPYTE